MARSYHTDPEERIAQRRALRDEDGTIDLPRIVARKPAPGDIHPLPKGRQMSVTASQNRLGIDIGRVIISGGGDSGTADTSFVGGDLENALRTPPMDGAFEAICQLARAFERRVWLVSKAGPRTEEYTRRWLAHREFFATTGIPSANVRFCRERRGKAGHCQELGITHFVDDRIQVLQLLQGIVPCLYHFGAEPSGSRVFIAVRGWSEAVEHILPLGAPSPSTGEAQS